MTEKLYYRDPYLRTFEAQVIETRQLDGGPAVVLDVTAFYPTAGGQPHDTGTLGGVRVRDVQMAKDGQILHLLDGPLTGTSVQGTVNWERRSDHMQQHTGQHILSQAFVQTCEAETVAFHMGEAVSTIDLDSAPLSWEEVTKAERAANGVVMEARPVSARFVDEATLTALPLRKMPVVEGPVRIVEVTEYDWSPCGGTHVRNSGEVGPISVVRIERRRDETRIHFLCGWRALADYAHKHQVVRDLVAHFTTSEDEILPSAERTEAEVKALSKRLTAMQMQLLEHEVGTWIARAQSIGGLQVVRLAFEDRELTTLKEACRRLTAQPGTVALLATNLPRPQLVFARSEGVAAHMGDLMRAACQAVGGRGGGRPQFAQGGAPEGSSLDKALDTALEQLGRS